MHHKEVHPEPVESCFGCKCIDQGVQTLQIKHGRNPTEVQPVHHDDTGVKVGEHHVHWNGRQDAVIQRGGA